MFVKGYSDDFEFSVDPQHFLHYYTSTEI
jgi:hypothetical protein